MKRIRDRYLVFSLRFSLLRSFQIRLTRGRPRHVVERFSGLHEHEAEKGLVPRQLSASQESGIRGGGATPARRVGGASEFGEGELRSEHRPAEESPPRGPPR